MGRWYSRHRDQKFSFTNFSFSSIVESTYKRAIALTERNGGRVEGSDLVVKLQPAVPAQLEIWDDYGTPVERIPVSDPSLAVARTMAGRDGFQPPGNGMERSNRIR